MALHIGKSDLWYQGDHPVLQRVPETLFALNRVWLNCSKMFIQAPSGDKIGFQVRTGVCLIFPLTIKHKEMHVMNISGSMIDVLPIPDHNKGII